MGSFGMVVWNVKVSLNAFVFLSPPPPPALQLNDIVAHKQIYLQNTDTQPGMCMSVSDTHGQMIASGLEF